MLRFSILKRISPAYKLAKFHIDLPTSFPEMAGRKGYCALQNQLPFLFHNDIFSFYGFVYNLKLMRTEFYTGTFYISEVPYCFTDVYCHTSVLQMYLQNCTTVRTYIYRRFNIAK